MQDAGWTSPAPWAGAIAKTAAGGEIDALDPGGFGAVTIKAITIDGGAGQITDTVVSHCGNALSVRSTASTATPPFATTVSVERSRFLFSTTTGVLADAGNALVQMANSTVFGNAPGLSATGQASLQSSGTNQTLGNTASGAFTSTVPAN